MIHGESPKSFEEAVDRLEQIVTAMETGTLPLHDCLAQFEQAAALTRFCEEQLRAAHEQIQVLAPAGTLLSAAAGGWAEAGAEPGAGLD